MPRLSLYLHIPFCRRKCPYCDFFSLPADAGLLCDYPGLLDRHLERAAASGLWQGPLTTVFFGGGTPSLLPPAAIGSILKRAESLFGFAPEAEISLEANPGTITAATLAGYRRAGINRLSLGVQSLDDGALAALGRIHRAAEARAAVAWARSAGFDNLGLDLMFALPGQRVGDLEREIDAYLALAPEHLSCYGLAVEEETPFHHRHRAGELSLPDDEQYAAFFQRVDRRLAAAGYRHYEISNYARTGRECRHNQRYWQRQAYLGVGAGAHSFCDRGWGKRLRVPSDLPGYRAALAADRAVEELLEVFDRRAAMAETLYLGLRTRRGVVEDEFRARFGCGVAEAFPEAVARCGERLALEAGCWRFDLAGWLLFDHLISEFL